ncbi:MAG: porin [Gammaproteobacteria bacterium]
MRRISTLLCTTLLVTSTAQAQDSGPRTVEDLWKIIQQQQAEIDALKNDNKNTQQQLADTQQQVVQNEQAVNATGDALENISTVSGSLADWVENTQIGSYGELHYNNLSAEDNEADIKEIDFHRFVLFLNHQFNDRLRLFSEIELEHSIAGDEEDGEFELEQAYIQYDLDDNHKLNGGLFLMPVGILNETHEPNTFYGVERNSIEKFIIPTTWWEAGAAVNGAYANGLSWDLAMTSGLEIGDNYEIRGGRQKVSEASANDPAYTARLKYTGISGLELSTSYQLQMDANQGKNSDIEQGQLMEAHAIYTNGGFGLRALWAEWDFDGDGIEAADADSQKGWYVEPSYRFRPGNWDIGVFARYEDVDSYKLSTKEINGAEDAYQLGQFDEWSVGVNYWPIPNVVIKADYRERNYDESKTADIFDFTGIDLGLGYSF